jgi:PAS domain S-box-containing protein
LIKYELPYEAVGLKKDGENFPVEIFSKIVPYQGYSVKAIAIRRLVDRDPNVLSELRRLNQELETTVNENTDELRYTNERLRLELEERRRIEERLKIADQIISTVDNLIFISNEQGQITYASPSIYRLLGYTPEDILGDSWRKLTGGETGHRGNEENHNLSTLALNFKATGPTKPYERQIYDKQGQPHWILWQDTKGPDHSIIRIGYDITERKQAEAEILQRNRELTSLQAANFAITSSLDLH